MTDDPRVEPTDEDAEAGQDLGELSEGDRLILTVVPLEEGPVRVTGVRFVYEQGSRSTSELVPYDFRVGCLPDRRVPRGGRRSGVCGNWNVF